MGKPQKKNDPSQEQEQAQANLQGQLQGQANLQGQLQGQGQGQGQAQGQAQLAVQSLDSKSDNDNSNDNKNSNKNSNDLDNKLCNNVDNKIENTIDNKVNVDVKVDLDLHATGLSSPVIDLHGFSTNDSLVMPEVVNQTLTGGGNIFHLDQVNNLIGDTTVSGASVSYNGGGSCYDHPGFSMDAKITGGESKIDDAHMASAVGAGAGIVSHADAALTQSAFTQTITTGANIQFNSATIQAAGHDLTDDHHTL